MQLIQNNPYRQLGLLVGATARQENNHKTRINSYLDAKDEIPAQYIEYEFECLGKIERTTQSISSAMANLTLGEDRINSALFWFWNGNPITDEAAFDALRDGDVETAYQIWDKLITETNEEGKRFWKPVTLKNFSAFHNCSLINLIKPNGNLQNAIVGKLYFLQSELIDNFISTVVDGTYKTTPKQLQLLFLNQLQSEIEKHKTISFDKLIKILTANDFIAKQDYLKVIIEKPINQIEQKIETAKNKRKLNKLNGLKAGNELFESTTNDFIQLKSIISSNDIKYTSIADKVANEILQCSIDYFNESQENDRNEDFLEKAMKLAQLAEKTATGSLTKDRIKDSIETLEEMKDREISQAINFLESVKEAYETNERQIKAEVKKIEQTDIDIILGHKSINWNAVEKNIKNSIDWQKVNLLLVEILSDKNLKKIKETNKTDLKKDFLELAMWVKENSQANNTITAIINKYKSIPPKLPFKILSSYITNTDKESKALPETNPLYKKHTRYVGMKINVECYENKTITIYKKYIGTNGKLSFNDELSPKGYTNSTIATINTNTKVIDLSGWGNSNSCTYEIGTHRIELYVDEFMIHSKEFIIDLAPSEKLEIELKKAEDKLKEIKNTDYYKSELQIANSEMKEIQEFHLFRSSSTKQKQISDQQRKIDDILQKAKVEKERLIEQQNKIIYKIKSDIQNADY